MAPNLSKSDRQRFLRVLHILRTEFKCAFPVKIRTLQKEKFLGYYGLTQLIDGKEPYFLITLKQDSYDIMFESLCHEWAHAKCWTLFQKHTDEEISWHCPMWGVCYSQIYSRLVDNSLAAKCST